MLLVKIVLILLINLDIFRGHFLHFPCISPRCVFLQSLRKISIFLNPKRTKCGFMRFWSYLWLTEATFFLFWTIFRLFRPTTISQKIFRLVGTYEKLIKKVEQVLFWTQDIFSMISNQYQGNFIKKHWIQG